MTDMDSMQLNDLANDIRRAGGIAPKPPHPSQAQNPKKGTRFTPDLGRVHIALTEGHITQEEAEDLNPKYATTPRKQLVIHAGQIKKFEKDPELAIRQRKARYAKRKAMNA